MASVPSIFGISINSAYHLRSALSGFSIDQETQADSIACQLLPACGYNAWEAKQFMKTMYTWLAHKERKYPAATATHPKLLKRYRKMGKWVAAIQQDSTSGVTNERNYQDAIGPYRERIIRLLLQSNCVNELKAMVGERFASGDSSAVRHRLHGVLLERYWPADSFAVARHELTKAIALDPAGIAGLRELGWLYLKNGKTDSARICLARYLENVPDAHDASIINFYLDQINE